MKSDLLNCIAIDDELLALELLEDNIKRIPFLNLRGKCLNAFDAMDIINKTTIDLMFVDIQMPHLTGIDFLKCISDKPMVIFLTAYKQHAIEGFELDAVDYLLKPVSFERFLKAVNKANEIFSRRKPDSIRLNEFFMVPLDYSMVRITMADVLYIEGYKDYVKIFLQGKTSPVITRMQLKELEDILPKSNFQRVQKSYIVNLDKVTSIRKRNIELGGIEIPVSDIYREKINDFFNIS